MAEMYFSNLTSVNFRFCIGIAMTYLVRAVLHLALIVSDTKV